MPSGRATATNLELIRAVFASWERGDFSSADWADADIEFVIADGPEPGSWRGREGMVEGWRNFLSAWQHWRGQAQGWLELDRGRVLVLIHGTGRGKSSGLDAGEMRSEGANVFEIHAGVVRRLVVYFDRERAFADLGVAPDTARSAAPMAGLPSA